jgi:O-methyltransferase involved in polyketide biosynthesis
MFYKGLLAMSPAPTMPGSEMVFQFIMPPASMIGEERALVETLAARAAAIGEPWLSFFEPEELGTLLRQVGFGTVIHFGLQEATERYPLGRGDGLRLPCYFHKIKARVE